jgi:hypothetical protein
MGIVIKCHWGHLVNALRRCPEANGVLTDRHTVETIVFVKPDGERLSVPENSELEIFIVQKSNMYAIGLVGEPESFTHGPYPDLQSALDIIPPSRDSKITCFSKEGTPRTTHIVNDLLEWEPVSATNWEEA